MPSLWGDDDFSRLTKEVEGIDEVTPGALGVYVKRLADGQALDYQASRPWYLASTIKIPLAIAILQRAESGDIALSEELVLAESDYVDGAGELLYAEPGTPFSIGELLGHMVENSDSTATDMLVRFVGEDEFNRQVRERMPADGINHITTILQVRHDAYSEVHGSARQLDNLDFINLKTLPSHDERYDRLLEKLGTDREQVNAHGIGEAFEQYYERRLNSGTLKAMGAVLEALVTGQLLSPAPTDRLLTHMEQVTTGDGRIKAGLADGIGFAHKTGTQVARACDVGVLHPRDMERAVIVSACVEGFAGLEDAEAALAQLGDALVRTGVAD